MYLLCGTNEISSKLRFGNTLKERVKRKIIFMNLGIQNDIQDKNNIENVGITFPGECACSAAQTIHCLIRMF